MFNKLLPALALTIGLSTAHAGIINCEDNPYTETVKITSEYGVTGYEDCQLNDNSIQYKTMATYDYFGVTDWVIDYGFQYDYITSSLVIGSRIWEEYESVMVLLTDLNNYSQPLSVAYLFTKDSTSVLDGVFKINSPFFENNWRNSQTTVNYTTVYGAFTKVTPDTQSVNIPEPPTLPLLAAGLFAIGWRVKKCNT